MAKRKYKLTWQPGTETRRGRWKSIIDGKAHYFDGGYGKTDRDAYNSALNESVRLKAETAKSKEKPNAQQYVEAIKEWEAVATWSTQNSEDSMASVAQNKVTELRKRLSANRPRPLKVDDRFFAKFEIPKALLESTAQHVIDKTSEESGRGPLIVPSQLDADFFGISPAEHKKRLWKDRIQSINQQDNPESKTIGGNLARYLEFHLARVPGKISAGRYDNIRRSVESFCVFAGKPRPVKVVNGVLMREFYQRIQLDISKQKFSTSYGRDRAADVDQFIRWLWREGIVDELPRNLGTHEIKVSACAIDTFKKSEIHTLLTSASEKFRLFILLALNCGVTQRDISDLHPTEVNWRSGKITRKRSKTKSHESTPTVTYRLWPETLKLLRKYRSNDTTHVLLNKIGRPLKAEEIQSDGRLKKTDAIGREFRRLVDRCNITGRSFIDLKKTSRSMLEGNKEYQPIAELFVGRAPATISEKHYAQPPVDWLAEATDWLRDQFEIERLVSLNRPAVQ